MATRDGLTNLWDRGTFDSEIRESVDEALRTAAPLALIVVDIDHFKRVNDTHGHQKGDAVLVGVAWRLQTVAKGKGKVYRYGGEEMLIVLPNHSLQEATAVAERARSELERGQVEGIAVTASFGVSTLPEHGRTSAELIKGADTALYDAKNRGRNLVRICGEPEPPRARPHEPERRLPEPGRLTETQRQQLRRDYFQGCRIVCPEDEAILDVHERNTIRAATRGLLVVCPMCGLAEEL